MKERAYAKINLCLDVVGRRDDGYHELKMIMVPVNFYDILEMNFADETSLALNRSYLPVNEKNTIIKAIRVMQERYGVQIRMINRMCRLNLPPEELIAAGKLVGADVPFCILNRPALVEGIGEKIMPFHCDPDFEILLVKPRKGVSTKEAFEIVDSQENDHPDCMALMNALIMNDYEGVVSNLGNSLEPAAVQLVSEIRVVKEKLTAMGFDGVLMSGSGSTVFGITRNTELLDASMEKLRNEKYFVRKTRIYTGE